MVIKNVRSNSGITLIELLIALAILSLVTATIFSMFFFGNRTYGSGRTQYDFQSNIRLASDVIRDRVRYVSDLEVLYEFDSNPTNENISYIYLAEDKQSIKLIEGNNSPVNIISSPSSDIVFDLSFAKGSDSGTAVRFSQSINNGGQSGSTLKYNIVGESIIEGKDFEVNTEVVLLNMSSQIPSQTYIEGPIADPQEGPVAPGTSVTLTTNESDATIYYTTNGENPNTSSSVYENPIVIDDDTIIKAITVKDGNSSSVATYVYSVSSKPTASDVVIVEQVKANSTVTVTYTYNSAFEIPQGGSTIRWYISNQPANHNNHSKVLVHTSNYSQENLTSRQYSIPNNKKNDYIYVEIIPRDNEGGVGDPVWSAEYKID